MLTSFHTCILELVFCVGALNFIVENGGSEKGKKARKLHKGECALQLFQWTYPKRWDTARQWRMFLGNLDLQASIFSYIILFWYLLKTRKRKKEHNTTIQIALYNDTYTTSFLEKTVRVWRGKSWWECPFSQPGCRVGSVQTCLPFRVHAVFKCSQHALISSTSARFSWNWPMAYHDVSLI